MPPEPFQILVAARDPGVRRNLVDFLTAAGFRIEEAISPEEATQLAHLHHFDIVLMGVDSSDEHCLETCKRLRAQAPDLGIVVVHTGSTGSAGIRALDAGADDCVVPPLRFREIVARVSAVLRRVRVEAAPKTPIIRAGELQLDADRRRFWRKSVEIHLSPREFDLLSLLMTHPETTLTHARILRSVWGVGGNQDTGDLRSYIKALRRKVEQDPANPEYIVTEPWVGYRFQVPRQHH